MAIQRKAPLYLQLVTAGLSLCAAWAQAGVQVFTEEAQSRGLTYVMQNYPQSVGYLGFGCGLVDLDADGDLDAVIVGAADGHVGVYENDGAGQFTDRSITADLTIAESSGLVAGDYDADGALDLYLTCYGCANVLAHNDGGFAFTDVAEQAMVDDSGPGKGAAWADYDGDGLLDLYVANYTGKLPGHNVLYHNLGDDTFEDVSAAQAVADLGDGFQPVWFDYDLDGDVDLYLSNDRGHLSGFPNQLWRNDAGQLVNVSAGSGADAGFYSMGVACGDFDGNGRPDLYCTNISVQTNDDVGGVFPLFLNQPLNTFLESSVLAGVDALGVGTGWGAIFLDFDNDTHLDLYVNSQFSPNLLFTSNGTFPCTEVANTLGVQGSAGASFSSAAGDVDGDGDVDLLVNNLSGNVALYINQEGQLRNWVRYDMIGRDGNSYAVGGRTNTRTGSDWQLREILAGGNSYLGQNELIMHVGLGEALIVDEVVATWPGGTPTRTLTNLPINHTWALVPPEQLGDGDGDGSVAVSDFVVLAGCYEAPFAPGCEAMDFDGDSDVQSDDFDAFLLVFDGTPDDCDDNGQIDFLDILGDLQLDQNGNGQLDTCEECGCASIANCADVDSNGVRDDGCTWWACDCWCESTAIAYADLGGANGACSPDGAADGNDRFHALNCFSNQSTTGGPGYPCAEEPPAAFNVDAAGLGAPCTPDGVCDGNDAFAALNAFSGTSTCTCGAPAPTSGSADAPSTDKPSAPRAVRTRRSVIRSKQ